MSASGETATGTRTLASLLVDARAELAQARSALATLDVTARRTMGYVDVELRDLIAALGRRERLTAAELRRLEGVRRACKDLSGVLGQVRTQAAAPPDRLLTAFRALERELVPAEPEPAALLRTLGRALRVAGAVLASSARPSPLTNALLWLAALASRVGAFGVAVAEAASDRSPSGRLAIGAAGVAVVVACVWIGVALIAGRPGLVVAGWSVLALAAAFIVVLAYLRYRMRTR